MQWWTNSSYTTRQTFLVPAPIVVCNKFMNLVDKADQLRAMNPIQQKEAKVSKTILFWGIDICIQNAYWTWCAISPDVKKESGEGVRKMDLREFKRQLLHHFVVIIWNKNMMLPS